MVYSSYTGFPFLSGFYSKDVILEMGNKGFLAGIKYSDNEILVAVTEKRTKAEIDKYITSLQEVDHA